MRRCVLAFAVVLVASASAASAADAAISFTRCAHSTLQCARVPVPLDPSGVTPGTITLTVERKVAPQGNTNNTAVVALAGGPGQAAVPLAEDLADGLKDGLAHQDLIVFDQRGTGSSNPLKCGALDVVDPTDSLTALISTEAKCANQIGTQRAFYTTAQSVADIEALRVSAGYSKLTIFGVSYGTKVAEEYAQTYPQNVAGLILDSVVTPTGPDAFNQATFTAIPRILTELCAGGACSGATSNVKSDLKSVLTKTAAHPLHGVVTDGHGRRLKFGVTSQDLFNVLLAGDLNPALRSLLPGALHGAAKGDLDPLSRVIAHSEGLNEIRTRADQTEVAEDNALFLDTTCEESVLPWPRTVTDPNQRRAMAKAAVAAVPSTVFAPFSRSDVLAGQSIRLCLGWPQLSAFPAPLGPLPNVPTLILEGQADLRTTVADAEQVHAAIPLSTLVVVPHNGHSVLGTDPSGCATKAVKAFFAGTPPQQCSASTPNAFAPVDKAPTSLATVKGSGKVLKTALAARQTIVDQYRLFVTDSISAGHIAGAGSRVGGLRGGFSNANPSGIHLHKVVYVPGVEVTGTISPRTLAGTVTITGTSAAQGSLHFSSTGTVSGTLDGQRVSAHLVSGREARFGAPPVSQLRWHAGSTALTLAR